MKVRGRRRRVTPQTLIIRHLGVVARRKRKRRNEANNLLATL